MQKRLENPVTIVMTFLMLCAVPGRCGALRIMLSDQGQEWKEVVVSFDEWTKGDLKKTCVSVLYRCCYRCALLSTSLLFILQSRLNIIWSCNSE